MGRQNLEDLMSRSVTARGTKGNGQIKLKFLLEKSVVVSDAA